MTATFSRAEQNAIHLTCKKKIHVREIEQFFLFRSFWLSAWRALKILRHRALRVYEGEDNFYRRSEEKEIKLKKKKSIWNVI